MLVHAGVADRRMWDPQGRRWLRPPDGPLRHAGLRREPAADRAMVAARRSPRSARRARNRAGPRHRGVDGGGDRGRGGPGPAASGRLPRPRGPRRRAVRGVAGGAAARLGGGGATRSIAATSRRRGGEPPGLGGRASAAPDAVERAMRGFVVGCSATPSSCRSGTRTWHPSTSCRRRPRPGCGSSPARSRRGRRWRPGRDVRRRGSPAAARCRTPTLRRAARRRRHARPSNDPRKSRCLALTVRPRRVTPGARSHRGRLRYVALGDSYTIGTATAAEAERWPDQLVARLGRTAAPRARRQPRRQRLHVARRDRGGAAAARGPATGVRDAPRRRQRRRPGRARGDIPRERDADPR